MIKVSFIILYLCISSFAIVSWPLERPNIRFVFNFQVINSMQRFLYCHLLWCLLVTGIEFLYMRMGPPICLTCYYAIHVAYCRFLDFINLGIMPECFYFILVVLANSIVAPKQEVALAIPIDISCFSVFWIYLKFVKDCFCLKERRRLSRHDFSFDKSYKKLVIYWSFKVISHIYPTYKCTLCLLPWHTDWSLLLQHCPKESHICIDIYDEVGIGGGASGASGGLLHPYSPKGCHISFIFASFKWNFHEIAFSYYYYGSNL